MAIYRIIMALALPFLVLACVLRPGPKGALAERLGFVRGTTGSIWVHAASLGEAASVRGLVAELAKDTAVFMTVNTTTARAVVAGWGTVQVALAPFDTALAPSRVTARIRPRAYVLVESELWPTRMETLAADGVPVIILGARMSARSAARWSRIAGVVRRMLQPVRYLSAQDAASEARFLGLGLPPAALGARINLKAYVADPAMVGTPLLPRARCVLAASTHEGEDGPVLRAFAQARAAGMFDLLILAPRHPARADRVSRTIRVEGLAFGQRSRGDVVDGGAPVYLADTLGEMAQWYAMAGVTIVGGSYENHGGHTPFEPTAAGSAIVHGPYVSNFAESYAALDAAGGALSGDVTQALLSLTPARQSALATTAFGILTPQGDLGGLVQKIRGLARPAAS